jgi:hypothetical protein
MQPVLPSIAASRPVGLKRNRWVYADAVDFQATLSVVNGSLDAYPGARLHWRIRAGTGELVK